MQAQKKPVLTAHSQEVSEAELGEKIHRRAYQLYEDRGRQDGHDLEDWLQAEAELRPEQIRTAAA
ncbi:MAG TPA: DUF2934 domain-containing protein [Candidatus Angelobacter sp.]